MTLLVRDEQDIIRENIEYHLAQGVSKIIATDNRSVDQTTHILKEYVDKGVLHLIYEGDDTYNQHEWVTRMAVMAYEEFGADWVINNDADEFWWPKAGNLEESLRSLPEDTDLIQAPRFNFVMLEQSDIPFHQAMIYREVKSLNSLGMPLPPKVAHRGSANIKVAQGNHSVSGLRTSNMATDLIEILHFPMRTTHQFTNKIKKGGAAYERNQRLSESVGATWRTLYSEIMKRKNLNNYFATHMYDNDRINAEIKNGRIVVDRRLADFFVHLYQDD
ncbi:glycosyltransferase family 2 protein [Pseudomonadota bacterium]